MSQDVSTNRPVLDASDLDAAKNPTDSAWQPEELEESIVNGIPSIASYADSLMDELFEDVDRILERGVKLSPELAQPEFVSLQPISIPHLILPPMLMPRAQLAESQLAESQLAESQLAELDGDTELNELVATVDQTEARLEEHHSTIDRLLLVAVGMSAIAAVTSWFVFQTMPRTATLATAPVSPADQLKAQENTRFTDYLQRSLANLDRKTAADRLASLPPGTATTAMPTVSVPGMPGVTGATIPSPTALERIYVPVYQPPQILSSASVAGATSARTSTAVAPAAVAPAASADPATAVLSTAPTATLPVTANVLMGIMQLGDRSAALFEIDGVAQRVYMGENIGTSGWSLVSVSNQDVVVRRNGEVRSVYVGQRF